MVAKIHTVAFRGIDVLDIDVEVQIANGMPAFTIVGLPDKAIAESKERVRGALHAMGLALPAKRITINLAPADVNKEGSHYDLPIALGLLVAMDVVPQDAVDRYYALGELGLDGSLRTVTGVLPAAIQAEVKNCGLICPSGSGREAAWAGDLDILAPDHLLQLINHFKGAQVLTRPKAALAEDQQRTLRDIATVKGQETAKRALEITANTRAPPDKERSLPADAVRNGTSGSALHDTRTRASARAIYSSCQTNSYRFLDDFTKRHLATAMEEGDGRHLNQFCMRRNDDSAQVP